MPALATKPLDITTFRAYKSGKSDDFPATAAGFGRFCRTLARSLASLGATPPTFTYERYEKATPANMPARDEDKGLTMLLIGMDPQYMARIFLEPPMIFALCDYMFGGSGNEPAFLEERPISHIETDVGQHFADVICDQLPHAFQNVELEPFARYKPSNDGLTEAPHFTPALRVTLVAALMGWSGEFVLECNEALAGLLVGKQKGEAEESAYSAAIVSHVEKSDVEVKAVLTSLQLTLGEITNMASGQLIRLPTAVGKPVIVESDGVVMHKARLGQQARRFCLSIL